MTTSNIIETPSRLTSTGKWEDRGQTLTFTAPMSVPTRHVREDYEHVMPDAIMPERPTPPPGHHEFFWSGSCDLTDLLAYLGEKTWVRKADLVAIAGLWAEREKRNAK